MNTHEEDLEIQATQLLEMYNIHPKHFETIKYAVEAIDPSFDKQTKDEFLDPEYMIDQHKARVARNKLLWCEDLKHLRALSPFNELQYVVHGDFHPLNYDKVLEAFHYFPGMTRKQQSKAIETIMLDDDYSCFRMSLRGYLKQAKGVDLSPKARAAMQQTSKWTH